MKITQIGKDYIRVDEDDLTRDSIVYRKIHLIYLDFRSPTKSKIESILKTFPKTNRYIVSEDKIKTYNYVLKNTSKKYYVKNTKISNFISFFRKNNKILVDFYNLSEYEKLFLLSDDVFIDLLRNVEVIIVSKNIFDEKEEILNNWNGNVIIAEKNEI
jgi:hypothetical protein